MHHMVQASALPSRFTITDWVTSVDAGTVKVNVKVTITVIVTVIVKVQVSRSLLPLRYHNVADTGAGAVAGTVAGALVIAVADICYSHS